MRSVKAGGSGSWAVDFSSRSPNGGLWSLTFADEKPASPFKYDDGSIPFRQLTLIGMHPQVEYSASQKRTLDFILIEDSRITQQQLIEICKNPATRQIQLSNTEILPSNQKPITITNRHFVLDSLNSNQLALFADSFTLKNSALYIQSTVTLDSKHWESLAKLHSHENRFEYLYTENNRASFRDWLAPNGAIKFKDLQNKDSLSKAISRTGLAWDVGAAISVTVDGITDTISCKTSGNRLSFFELEEDYISRFLNPLILNRTTWWTPPALNIENCDLSWEDWKALVSLPSMCKITISNSKLPIEILDKNNLVYSGIYNNIKLSNFDEIKLPPELLKWFKGKTNIRLSPGLLENNTGD